MKDSLRSFEWKDIGDIERGRPTLGDKTNVAVYRMFQYSLCSILENNYGKETVKQILVEAGRAAGREFCRHVLDFSLPAEEFFPLFKQKAIDLGIGLLEIEYGDFENMIFILTISEDLDCSGLPITGETVCSYDEGFIMGILEVYADRQFIVRETDCWSTGDWTCRFHIAAI